jgi:diguanylate cyclase (GGDEF)-like protein/PAS domain S-box-containing protein
MEIDIRTLSLVNSIAAVIQVIALTLQYILVKTYRGIGWWLIGFLMFALGFLFAPLRDISQISQISIFFHNLTLILGIVFLYIGLLRFLNLKENKKIIIFILVSYIFLFTFFLYIQDDITARTVIFSSFSALLMFSISFRLLKNLDKSLKTSQLFVVIIFFLQGCFLLFRTFAVITISPVSDFFTPTLTQSLTFLSYIIIGNLFTFGFIIMVNQRLNIDMKEAKEHFELIFNTSPDAAIITRLDNGEIVSVNDSFTNLTGFNHKETLGKSILELNIWKNPADRQKLIDDILKNGFCDNFESEFLKKDGTQIFGIISAKTINLHGIPHIISVTRDITIRRKVLEALKLSEERYHSLFENMIDGYAYCEMVYTEQNQPVDFIYLEVNKSFERLTGLENVVGKPVSEVIPGAREMNPELFEAYNRVALSGKSESFEIFFKPLNIWFDISVFSPSIGFFVAVFENITDRKKVEEELQHLASIDGLTGIYNRRFFIEACENELTRFHRYGKTFTFLMMDIDTFKSINDQYGHLSGDQVLQSFVKTIENEIRNVDSLGRMGGEEFGILLIETPVKEGLKTAKRIQNTLQNKKIQLNSDQSITTKVSMGLTEVNSEDTNFDSIISRADRALYKAKNLGKNRIEVSE